MPLVAQHPGTERKFNRDVSISYNLLATDDYSAGNGNEKIAGVDGFQIVVQRLVFAITTTSARSNTFQSDVPTPFAVIPNGGQVFSPPYTFDFGEDGYVLADGASLMHKNSGAGVAASVVIQAYLRPTPESDLIANTAGTRGFSV